MDEHVEDLTPINLCWSIEVKVLNKWRVRSEAGHRSLRMVMTDKRVIMFVQVYWCLCRYFVLMDISGHVPASFIEFYD